MPLQASARGLSFRATSRGGRSGRKPFRPHKVRGEIQMSNHLLSGLRPRTLAIAVTLCCIAPAAMAAGRQDLANANLAQMQARYSSFVAANGTPGMAHARHERLLNMDSE